MNTVVIEDLFWDVVGNSIKSIYDSAFALVKDKKIARRATLTAFHKLWRRRISLWTFQNMHSFVHIAIRKECIDFFTLQNNPQKKLHRRIWECSQINWVFLEILEGEISSRFAYQIDQLKLTFDHFFLQYLTGTQESFIGKEKEILQMMLRIRINCQEPYTAELGYVNEQLLNILHESPVLYDFLDFRILEELIGVFYSETKQPNSFFGKFFAENMLNLEFLMNNKEQLASIRPKFQKRIDNRVALEGLQ